MNALIRLALLTAALVIGVWIIAEHGLRGILLVTGLVVVYSLTRTRAWRTGEGWMVRLTGSRTRAAAVVLGAIIALTVVVNVVSYLH